MDESNDILPQVLSAISEISSDVQEKLRKINERIDTLETGFIAIKDTSETLIKEARENVIHDSRKIGIEKQLASNFAGLQNAISEINSGMKNDLAKQSTELLGTIQDVEKNFTKKYQEILSHTEKDKTELNDILLTKLEVETTQIKKQASTINKEFQEQLTNTNKKFTDANTQLTKLFNINENHSEVILTITDLIKELRENYLENFNEIKNDQKNLMTSFQRITTALGENIRNEIIILSKDVRTQFDNFIKDSSTVFMLKSDGDRIDDRQKVLDHELRSKAEIIHQELVHSLDDSLENFNNAIKGSINSVNEVKLELEKYKDDIESMIERKVNEKYEFVFELLSSVLTRTETLTSLVREARIISPATVEVPIKDLVSNQTIVNP